MKPLHRALPILLAVVLLGGCAAAIPNRASSGPPGVGAKVTPAQTDNLIIGDRVNGHTLTWQDLTTSNFPARGMQKTRISAALKAGRPVALFFDTAGDGTQGVMEIQMMEELRNDYGNLADFILVDPSLDGRMAQAWNLDLLHAVFLINPKGVITYEYLGLWGIDDIKPHLNQLVGLP